MKNKMKKILVPILICASLMSGFNVTTLWGASCTGNSHVGYHWVVTKPATCLNTGEKVSICSCGKVRADCMPTPALGHNWVYKPGLKQCTRCATFIPT